MVASFPEVDEKTITALDSFNRAVQRRFRTIPRAPKVAQWAPGEKLTPSLRGEYETFFPIEKFKAHLRRLAHAYLPSPDWIPETVKRAFFDIHAPEEYKGHASIPDFLCDLPQSLANRLERTAEELLHFFCSLADPPGFGTDIGRYPRQLEEISSYVSTLKKTEITFLDLGCGVGSGTYEVEHKLTVQTGKYIQGIGITPEPLEVWMASEQRIPHDPIREAMLRTFQSANCRFLVGNAQAPPWKTPVDFIVCNGLAGGKYLKEMSDFHQLLKSFSSLVNPGGAIFLANRFHAGRTRVLESFIELASDTGFHISGSPDNLMLKS